MSTCIYNAFLLRPDKGFNSLLEVSRSAQALRTTLEAKAREAIADFIACIAVAILDRRALGIPQPPHLEGSDVDGSPAHAAMDLFLERLRHMQRTQGRDPAVDLDFSLTLYPVAGNLVDPAWSADREVFIGQVFSDRRDWVKALFALPGVADFHYQNQTDYPERISATEWAARKQAWEQALGDDVPAARGFSIDLVANARYYLYMPERAEIVAAARRLTPQQRLRDYIEERLEAEFMAAAGWAGNVAEARELHHSWRSSRKTDDYQQRLAAVLAEMAPRLPTVDEASLYRTAPPRPRP